MRAFLARSDARSLADPKDAPDYWPTTERSIANVGAAFPEAIIRTLFGFQPRWHQPAAGREPAAKARAVEQQLLLPKVARPFVGRLANYKYFNMDQAVLNALEYYDKLERGGTAVPP